MTDEPPGGLTADADAGLPRCAGLTTAGQPCRARVFGGHTLCLPHDPDRQDAMHAARSKGGKTATRLRAIRGSRPRLDSVPRLLAFNSRLVYQVLDGSVAQDTARTLVYANLLTCRLVELAQEFTIEQRVAALEAAIAAQQPQPKAVRAWVG